MTVYVVFYYDNDDSCICGVFDTLLKAQTYVEARTPAWDQVNYDIQTWEVL